MGGEGTVLGVIVAVVGVIGSVLVARISSPQRARPAPEEEAAGAAPPPPSGLQVSPEIWQYVRNRFATLEAKVDNLTALVEQQKVKVSTLERLLRMAMRIINRANKRFRAARMEPEDVPAELVPYSID